MSFFRRLQYYLAGVGLGTLLVYMFFKDRDFDAWLPEGRVLEQLLRNEVNIEALAACQVNCLELDNDWLKDFLKNADVVFSKSETQREPCPVYLIEGELSGQPTSIHVELCRDISSLRSVVRSDKNCPCN